MYLREESHPIAGLQELGSALCVSCIVNIHIIFSVKTIGGEGCTLQSIGSGPPACVSFGRALKG